MSKRSKVLIAEDDEAILQVLRDVMRVLLPNIELHTTSNGQEAYRKLTNSHYDALILDLMLPGLAGEEMLRQLDALPSFKGFPVLVNSAAGDSQAFRKQLRECQNLIVENVPRPAEPATIANHLKTMLALKAASGSPK